MCQIIQALLFIFLIGTSSAAYSSPSSVAAFDRSIQKNKMSSFPETDILNIFMHESLLVNCRFKTLMELFERECEVDEDYEGPKSELKIALAKKTSSAAFEEIVPELYSAYLNGQNKPIKFMLSCLTDRFAELVAFIKSSSASSDAETSEIEYPREFVEFIESVEKSLGIDKNYVVVNYADYSKKAQPHIPTEELMRFEPKHRFTAAICHILGHSYADELIDSNFIKNEVLSKFDLHSALILYEIEVADLEHSHDLDGVIEKHLKAAMFFEKNNVMAFLALEMFNQNCLQALKFIVDTKFSYQSPIRNPIWFQDLFCLREYAIQMSYPEGFFETVKQLASPAALRRLQTCIKAHYEHRYSYFLDEDEEEMEIIQFGSK